MVVIERQTTNLEEPDEREWMGPGCLVLCRRHSNSMDQIFIHYPFSINVWSLACEDLNINTFWGVYNSEDNFNTWYHEESSYKFLPIFIS